MRKCHEQIFSVHNCLHSVGNRSSLKQPVMVICFYMEIPSAPKNLKNEACDCNDTRILYTGKLCKLFICLIRIVSWCLAVDKRTVWQ